MSTIGEVNGETVKSAVSLAIKEAFTIAGTPPIYPKIYKEKIIQGMVKPCFFVWIMNMECNKLMLNNYNLVYQINVRYHPTDDDQLTYEHLVAKGLKLSEVLDTINIGMDFGGSELLLKIQATQVSYNIVDGILQFYATYTIKVKKSLGSTDPEMEDLEINQI